ncbi:MAG: TolC family protein, partial [Gemmataceae bacterium]|nr:TolC family protein [Gemmataceae bacterium]
MESSSQTSGRRVLRWLAGGAVAAGAVGCASGPPAYDPPAVAEFAPAARKADPGVIRASHQEPAAKAPPAAGPPPAPNEAVPAAPPVQVDELVRLAVARNPRLGRAIFNIDAAQGRQVQAGLYPNPNLGVNWDEIGDRTGPGGILNVPRVTQEIVTGHKLSLSQAVAAREVDQATLALLRDRYALIGNVRAAFYDLYALERRIAVLDELVKLAGDAVRTGQTLLEAKQVARLDVVQLEVELARFRSQAEAARRELPGARARVAAVVGDPRLPVGEPAGPFDEVPRYDPQ